MYKFHQFLHPYTALVAGPTGCGKTEFVFNLLLHNKEYIQPSPTKIYYYYSIWNGNFSWPPPIWYKLYWLPAVTCDLLAYLPV